MIRKISKHLNANSLANLRETHRRGRTVISKNNVKNRLTQNNRNRNIQRVLDEINFWNKPPRRFLNVRTSHEKLNKIRARNARVYTKKVSIENKLRMARELLRKVPTTGPGSATKWRMGLIQRINQRVGPKRIKVRLPGRQEFAISAPNQGFYRVNR